MCFYTRYLKQCFFFKKKFTINKFTSNELGQLYARTSSDPGRSSAFKEKLFTDIDHVHIPWRPTLGYLTVDEIRK